MGVRIQPVIAARIGHSSTDQAREKMRIVGFPEESADGAIKPVTLADVVFEGTPEELRSVGEFLIRMSFEMQVANESNSALYVGLDLGNDRPNADVGLAITVARYLDE